MSADRRFGSNVRCTFHLRCIADCLLIVIDPFSDIEEALTDRNGHQRRALEAISIIRAQLLPGDSYREVYHISCNIVGGVLIPPCGVPLKVSA